MFVHTEPWVSGSIFGRVKLPPGYGLAVLPANSVFEEDCDDPEGRFPITLSNGYNAMKILVSIGQLIFASSTLYRARGDQISRYGFAAFGLTVTQYALMSLLNLLGSLMCPEYSNFYLVENDVSDDARKHPGTVIEGTVGRLMQSHGHERRRPGRFSDPQAWKWWRDSKQFIRAPIALIPTCVSVAIIGVMSHFRAGSSTSIQRSAIISWLVVGSYIGAANAEVRKGYSIMEPHPTVAMLWQAFTLILGGVPAILGFVIVGKMLQEYGNCVIIS